MSLMLQQLREEGSGVLDQELGLLLARLDGRAEAGAAVALAGALASAWRRHQHSCLPLEQVAGRELGAASHPCWGERALDLRTWRTQLASSPVVAAAGESGRALVLEGDLLYLDRLWTAETEVARQVLERLIPLPLETGSASPGSGDGLLEAACARRLLVLSGGPGSGKTTSVARVLEMALSREPGLRFRLAAPTGKAAARLQEALEACRATLPPKSAERLAGLPPASTIHRLLQERDGSGRLGQLDWLVVDEASMADLPLMAELLSALPAEARVLLVGDPDQLASVEAGSVLGELCVGLASRPADGAPSALLRLTASRRFAAGSGIGDFTRLLREGEGARLPALLREGREDLLWLRPGEAGWGEALGGELERGFAPLLEAESRDQALAALGSFRALCGQRHGRLGVEGLNTWCERRWRGGPQPARPAPLLVTANDARLGVFNGDGGLLEGRVGEGARCVLASGGTGRELRLAQLPGWALAWALTIHQSQGSEWDSVLLLLPEAPSPLLCRELLYTGATRARRKLILVATEQALLLAAGRKAERCSGLSARLGA